MPADASSRTVLQVTPSHAARVGAVVVSLSGSHGGTAGPSSECIDVLFAGTLFHLFCFLLGNKLCEHEAFRFISRFRSCIINPDVDFSYCRSILLMSALD